MMSNFIHRSFHYKGKANICKTRQYSLPAGKIIQALLGFSRNSLLVLAAWIFLDFAPLTFHKIHTPVSSSSYFYLFQVYQLQILPNPANTSKLFQENPRNELGLSWIFLNIQARLSLDFQEILTSFFLQGPALNSDKRRQGLTGVIFK